MYEYFIDLNSGFERSDNLRHLRESEVEDFRLSIAEIVGFAGEIGGARVGRPGEFSFVIDKQDPLVAFLIVNSSQGSDISKFIVTIDELNARGEFLTFKRLSFNGCKIANHAAIVEKDKLRISVAYQGLKIRTNWVE